MLLPAPLSTACSQLGTPSGSGTWVTVEPHVSRSFRDAIPAPQRLFYMSHLRIAIRYDFRHWGLRGSRCQWDWRPAAAAGLSRMQITRQPLLLVRDCHRRWKSDRIAVHGGGTNGDGAMPFPPYLIQGKAEGS
ncbi:hypothetical protein N431DRAFT_211890 [Stipitochalara longipes BDJ]|nr:hypothetical protein N431DRAFT_211890 [Stipitochalara longipes BDJ]